MINLEYFILAGEKTFTCHLCSKAYTHKQNLNNHLKTAHIENDLTFKCDLCFKVLANSNSLRVHINKIHKADKNIGETEKKYFDKFNNIIITFFLLLRMSFMQTKVRFRSVA